MTFYFILQKETFRNALDAGDGIDRHAGVGDNAAEIVKTNNSVTTVASRVDDNDDDIAALQVQADEISSAVFETTQSGTKVSRIAQNANGISAVVTNVQNINTNLNDSTKARQNYTAIQVMQDGIASKCTLNDATSYFQQTHSGFYIEGSLIHIKANNAQGTGGTLIDGNVIASGMIQAGAITSEKIAAKAITADKLSIGSESGARIVVTTNLLTVYDANGIPRVKLGVWT